MLFLPVALSACSAINLLIGTLAQLLLVRKLGIGSSSDALFVAQAIPLFLSTVGTNVLYFSLVPHFSNLPASSRASAAKQLYLVLAVVLGLLSLLLSLSAPLWFWHVFSRDLAHGDEVIRSFQILLGMVPLAGISATATALLISQDRLLLGTAVPLVGSAVLATAFATSWIRNGFVEGVACVYVVSFLAQAAAGVLWSRSFGLPSFDQLKASIRDSMGLRNRSGPILASQLLSKVGEAIDRIFGSHLALGNLSQQVYAYKLAAPIATVLGSGISTTSFALFSKNASGEALKKFPGLLLRRIRSALLLLVLVIPVAWALSEFLVDFVFHRLLGNTVEVGVLAAAYRIYLIWIVFVVLADQTSRALYALGLGRSLILLSLFELGIGILCRYYFISRYSVMGIPMAAVAAFAIGFLAQWAIVLVHVRRHESRQELSHALS